MNVSVTGISVTVIVTVNRFDLFDLITCLTGFEIDSENQEDVVASVSAHAVTHRPQGGQVV